MRFTVSDDWFIFRGFDRLKELVELLKVSANVVRMLGEQGARRLGEGSTSPLDIKLFESTLEFSPLGQSGADGLSARRHRGIYVVQAGEHPDESRSLIRFERRPETRRCAFNERIHGDRVTRVDPADGFSPGGRQRRDDELEAGVMTERVSGVERTAQTFERGVAIGTEIALLVEIVGGDEIALSRTIDREPVVAAATDGKVLKVRHLKAPTVRQ